MSADTENDKMTAILSADVNGISHMIRGGAIKVLKEHRQAEDAKCIMHKVKANPEPWIDC